MPAPSYAFISLLSPDECSRRMSDQIDPPIFLRGDRPVYGRVHGNMFWIEKRIGYRNSFKTRLTAKLEPAQGGGTRIACKAGIAPFTTLFMYVWFVMFTFATFVTIATKSNAATGVPMFLLFGGALFAVGRYMARDEKAFLADYLRKVLVAREATEN